MIEGISGSCSNPKIQVDSLDMPIRKVKYTSRLVARTPGFLAQVGEVFGVLMSQYLLGCVGQDNTNSQCTIGTVPNVFEGNVNDHSGKFKFDIATTVLFLKCSRKFRPLQRSYD